MGDRARSVVQRVFFRLAVRPVLAIVIGLNVRHRERLPMRGPAIVVANHNSHLDTVVLMTLFPPGMLPMLRPVAAADYFLGTRILAAFTLNVMHIIPVQRGRAGGETDPLAEAGRALDAGEIVILFPEGTRGAPERIGPFKAGVAHLALRHPDVPVYPIYMHGLGKALPRGSALIVPFFCDVFVGDAVRARDYEDHDAAGHLDHKAFTSLLAAKMRALEAEGGFEPWS
jgi:1-acyl-sn-glycerol-3-phosphate acyltransferase